MSKNSRPQIGILRSTTYTDYMASVRFARPVNILLFSLFTAFAFLFSKNLALHFPDEHFQTIEIAHYLVHDVGWKAWEWGLGTRSYFIPMLYAPFIFVMSWFGIQSGEPEIFILKILTSLLVSSGVFFGLTRSRDPISLQTRILLGLMLFSPFFLYFSTTTFTDTLSMGFMGLILPLWIHLAKGEKKPNSQALRTILSYGCVIGFLFLFRIQNALLFLGLGGALLMRREWKAFGAFTFGVSVALVFSGLLDWITWGTPFQSTIQNIYWNIWKGVASSNGVQPFSFYFFTYAEYFGWGLFTILFSSFIYQSLKNPTLYLGPILFLVGHCLIPHKELRFLLPLIPFFFLATIDTLNESLPSGKKKWVILAILFIVSISTIEKWKSQDFTTPFGIAELTLKTGPIFQAIPAEKRSLLLIDSYWVWGRGELGIGVPVRWKEISLQSLPEILLSDYSVMIFGRGLDETVVSKLKETHVPYFVDEMNRSIWMKRNLN
jgi:hypothetical protein